MNRYLCGAVSDIGCERELQEDFVQFRELDDDTIIGVVADGTGSRKEFPHPAAVVSMHVVDSIVSIYQEQKDLFLQAPEYFLKRAFLESNQVLGAFKIGNEELFSGYACSITCCICRGGNQIILAHSGNTRLYLMREGVLRQLTRDHTVAQRLLDEGKIDIETYHVIPDRLQMTSGIGILAEPEIQTMAGRLKENDLILLSTDGVHYALRPDAMSQIILESGNCNDGAQNLVSAAKDVVHYPDNMSCMIIYERQQEDTRSTVESPAVICQEENE